MNKTHNFSAGPAILPEKVFRKSREAITNFRGTGLSILEVSHRSPEVVDVIEHATTLVRELLQLPDSFHPLFLTGGASSQFFLTAMNLLTKGKSAAYINTGNWSTKAIKEAKLFGEIDVIASSEDKNFNYIPEITSDLSKYQYLHFTSNNTIYGTQFHDMPETDIPLVCDMSSDIFSRRIDAEKYGVIYAGAQKNMGPAGVTLAIVNEDVLGKTNREIPTILDYRTHIKKNSAFNTPPVFPIYVSMLTLDWLKSSGGIDTIKVANQKKAEMLYHEIDTNPLFHGTARKVDRSIMNVCFDTVDENLREPFLKHCTDNNISGIKGHRSVGGFRASIYNAMPVESVSHLVEVMRTYK